MSEIGWDPAYSVWVATDDRWNGIQGRGRTKEEARANLAVAVEASQRSSNPDETPVWSFARKVQFGE